MSVFTFIRFISLTSAVGGVVGVVVRGAVCLFLPLLSSSLSRRLWGVLWGCCVFVFTFIRFTSLTSAVGVLWGGGGVVGVLCVCFHLY